MRLLKRALSSSGGWRVAAVPALIVMSFSGIAAGAASPSAGSTAHGSGGNGTIAAQGNSACCGAGTHAVVKRAAPQDATGALSTVLSETVHGGYTAAGVGMRNLGYGTISITGVPAGATVESATLLWDVLADQTDPSFSQGSFNGSPINGTEWATGASPCWPPASNFSYEADVTSLVTGNGSYALAGFATGESDAADPWNVGSAPPLLEGASLVVVYQLASMPQATVQIAEGATETDSGNEADAAMDGFTVTAPASVTTTYIVADGQEAGNSAAFNGNTLPDVSFPGGDPQAAPSYSQGSLWDTVTTDVSSDVTPGDTSETLSVTGNDDCLVWVGQVLSVTNGGVLALGDSVAAGYGLGPSEGSGDNPSAYPAVLGQLLGVPVQNYAVEGACASQTEPSWTDCAAKPSVAQQLKQVPPDFVPRVVTLTVGADDIDFGDCLNGIMRYSDYFMKSSGDPCNPTKLSTDLAHFQASLRADLNTISSTYPDAKILVMDYYNPFPPPPGTNSPCLINKILAVPYEHHVLAETWLKIITQFVLHHATYVDDARTVQKLLHDDARTVLHQLNTAVNSAASGVATVVPVSFVGHTICAHGTEWAFSPTAALELKAHVFSLYEKVHFGFGGDDICPDPVSSLDWNLKIDKSISAPHVSAQLAIGVGVNCLPHPTANGQLAIANDFFQVAQQP